MNRLHAAALSLTLLALAPPVFAHQKHRHAEPGKAMPPAAPEAARARPEVRRTAAELNNPGWYKNEPGTVASPAPGAKPPSKSGGHEGH